MNITGSSHFGVNLPIMQKMALKSTQEKAERRQAAAGEIAYWENKKGNLKNMECGTPEDIAKKLEKLHSYEDAIASVRMQYNQEQMMHLMDEAIEIGEKIAEAAEKLEPKTAEERREEMAEETLGTDGERGILTEIMESQEKETEIMESQEKETEIMESQEIEEMEETNGQL